MTEVVLLGRRAVREVFRTQLDNEPEEQIRQARARLNAVYERFVSKFGFITGKDNYRAGEETCLS